MLSLEPRLVDRAAVKAIVGDGVASNYSELAAAFGVQESTIRQGWALQGMPGRGDRRYPIAEIAAWRLEHLLAIEAKQRGVQELTDVELKRRTDEAEARKLEAQAHRLEFENERERGDWVRQSDVVTMVNTILAVLAQRMNDFPHKIAPSLPEGTAKQVVPFVQGEIVKLLKWVSEELRRKVTGAE